VGIFTRFKDIVSANINSLLDAAEDPEKMLRLMMTEMEDTIVDMKSSCAGKMARKKEELRQKEALEKLRDRWAERAVMALERKREDLAREALKEKKHCKAELDLTGQDLKHYDTMISECRINIIQLEEKLELVRQKHKMLKQREKHAWEKKTAGMQSSAASSHDAARRFEDMENRIDRMEAEADLYSRNMKSEDEFATMEQNVEIDEELELLKNKMKEG